MEISKLHEILQKQLAIYKEIESIEVDKKDAITKRNVSLLDSYIESQGLLVEKINLLENERIETVTGYATQLGMSEQELSLTNICSRLAEKQAKELLAIGEELKSTLKRITRLAHTNDECIKDNLKLYKSMMESLKDAVSYEKGYSNGGRLERSVSNQPALFSQTV